MRSSPKRKAAPVAETQNFGNAQDLAKEEDTKEEVTEVDN